MVTRLSLWINNDCKPLLVIQIQSDFDINIVRKEKDTAKVCKPNTKKNKEVPTSGHDQDWFNGDNGHTISKVTLWLFFYITDGKITISTGTTHLISDWAIFNSKLLVTARG